MSIPTVLSAVGTLCAALLALGVYHNFVVKPALQRANGLIAQHDDLIGDGGGSASARLRDLEAVVRQGDERGTALESRLAGLESLARSDVSRIGFVRYDAFDDTGSDLSYALALLNREGDGVVLTSLYSRTDTRTFGKSVSGFAPNAAASEEELQAIERARASV